MSEKIKILYIDDEPDNLFGFKASLRIHYDILIASSASEAATFLENNSDIRIIFCDQRMPDKTGVEFFQEIRGTYPLPIRILLTAYADMNSVIDAINLGHIYRFVKKPWEELEIISCIEEANKFYISNSMLSVKHEELKKAYEELDKFAYSVSHDIRGPLSGIIGAINISKDMNDISEMKEMLMLMGKSLKKLDTYIMSMHDYYSLQRGELRLKSINFNELVAELQETYKHYETVHHIQFNVNVNQTESFRSDEIPLRLILNNLLSNAFKYQKKNSEDKIVNLDIEVKKNKATIQIKDTGVGILGNQIGEIFNLFYRASSEESGSGFGLYNAKSALLKLNGQIEVHSILNEGTTFKVILPSK